MNEQLSLQLEPRTWGGKREGAGRKRGHARDRHGPSHVARPVHVPRFPLHTVLRALPDVPRLRVPSMIPVVSDALEQGNRGGFGVVHVSIQHNHLLAEADDGIARSRGMQYLGTLLAKGINRAIGRRGKVFEDRYHSTSITNPTQMLNTIGYVLCNWRHHDEDRACPAASRAMFDPYSSALVFAGWTATTIDAFDPKLAVAEPKTWLLREGWKLVGRVDPYLRP